MSARVLERAVARVRGVSSYALVEGRPSASTVGCVSGVSTYVLVVGVCDVPTNVHHADNHTKMSVHAWHAHPTPRPKHSAFFGG